VYAITKILHKYQIIPTHLIRNYIVHHSNKINKSRHPLHIWSVNNTHIVKATKTNNIPI